MSITAQSLPGLDGLSGCMSLFGQLSRLVVRSCLRLSDFSSLTGLSVSPSAPGISAQWKKPAVRNKLVDLLSAGDPRRAALLRAVGDPRSLVPWMTCDFERSDSDLVASPLLPNLERLRYCPFCWFEGRHWITDQLPWIERCAEHDVPFITVCGQCGRELAMDSPRIAVVSPFRCEHCHGLIGGMRASPSGIKRDLAAMLEIAKAAEARSGMVGGRASAYVMAVPNAEPWVVDEMCHLVKKRLHEDLVGADSVLAWIKVAETDHFLRAALAPLRSATGRGDDPGFMLGLATARAMSDAAVSFVENFYAAGRMNTHAKHQCTDAVSRAKLFASQFARRSVADAWLRASMLWSERSASPSGTAGPTFVQWMLSGPIRLLGRYSGIQALLNVGDSSIDSWGEPGRAICASRHAGVVRIVYPERVSLELIGVQDQTLLHACRQVLA